MTPARKWEPADLVGFRLSLVDSKRISAFTFNEDGWVLLTAGRVGGPVTAPVLKWRIDKVGLLHIEDVEKGGPHIRMRKQCAGDRGFIVDWDGVREELAREQR
jgi:hypothetical protein